MSDKICHIGGKLFYPVSYTHLGAGGQLDFVLGAYMSNGGKSFICCSSTFTDKQGVVHSRIRPTLVELSLIHIFNSL